MCIIWDTSQFYCNKRAINRNKKIDASSEGIFCTFKSSLHAVHVQANPFLALVLKNHYLMP